MKKSVSAIVPSKKCAKTPSSATLLSTESGEEGAVVPIPTLPLPSTVIAVTLPSPT